MKKNCLLLILVAVCLVATPFGTATAAVNFNDSAGIQTGINGIQIPFIENRGQIHEDVAFYARTFGGTLYVTKEGKLVLTMPVGKEQEVEQTVIREEIVGGAQVVPTGLERSVAKINTIIGNDPAKWQRELTTYDTVWLGEIYEGIELRLRAYGKSVEKVFTARPGADPARIRVQAKGITKLAILNDGKLSLQTPLGAVTYSAPVAYQETDAGIDHIQVAYVVQDDTYGFELGPYDKDRPLVIDPILRATYLGGEPNDDAYSLALDDSGHVYVAGVTYSSNFPGVDGTSAQDTLSGTTDAFIAHLGPAPGPLYQATYLGGTSNDQVGLGNGEGPAIAVHPINNNVYVTGYTLSANFPNVSAGAQSTKVGGAADAFIAVLDPDLKYILAATYFGGGSMDLATAMAVDPLNGDVYITGRTQSSNLPGVSSGFDSTLSGTWDAFAARFSLQLDVLRQATYIGGSGIDWPFSIMTPVDSGHPGYGLIYVTGETGSTNFPGTAGGYQETSGGYNDAFIMELSTSLDAAQSTYIGGTGGDTGYRIKVHPNNEDLYVCGSTGSFNFPGTSGGAQAAYAGTGGRDAFIASLASHMGTLRQSTYLGGSASENNCDLSIDSASGNIYLAGTTFSGDFPGTSGGAQPASAGDNDVYVARLSEDLTSLHQATYVGGSSSDMGFALDVNSNGVYITGLTWSGDFPGMSSTLSFQPTHGGAPYPFGKDAFVVRLDSSLAAVFDADINVSPLSLDFGTIAVGDTLSLPIVITNQGAGSLTIDLIQVEEGTNFAEDITRDYGSILACSTYAVSSTDIVLAGTDDCAVYVIFDPASEASHADTLTIGSSDPDEEYIDIPLVGVGGSGPDISLDPASHDFGPIMVGDSVAKAFSISNLGDLLLVVSNVELSDKANFSSNLNALGAVDPCNDFSSSTGLFELLPGETCYFEVKFDPEFPGVLDETLRVDSNDAYNSSVTASLTGGTDIGLDPTFWDFGDIDIDSVEEKTFTLTNHGSTAVTVYNIDIADRGSPSVPLNGWYVVTGASGLCPDPTFELTAGTGCDFIVEFIPAEEGYITGWIVLDTFFDYSDFLFAGEVAGSASDPDGGGPCGCSFSDLPEGVGFGPIALLVLFVYGLWIWGRKRRI